MLSDWYHHRGQLSVYLRLLDVPGPAIYGPNPVRVSTGPRARKLPAELEMNLR
jgi:uncharacterized damage-inducible protein DinB